MDQITDAILAEFAKGHQIDDLPPERQFEHLAAFVTLRRHHTRTFDTDEIVVGGGGDTAIDSVAILVNGALVCDVDAVRELKERNGYIEASFVFTQADRGNHFEGSKAGDFGFGVQDFFAERPTLVRNQSVLEAAKIAKEIFANGNLFRTKPTCRLYYVTTGNWQGDQTITARINGAKAALDDTKLFSTVEYLCYGADDIHRLYNQTKNAVQREFIFKDQVEAPLIDGVDQAYLGFVPANELLKVISDESGDDV
ncbi:MAG: hypothetical protein RIE56_02845, partial [Amphiplicatus sp.]